MINLKNSNDNFLLESETWEITQPQIVQCLKTVIK